MEVLLKCPFCGGEASPMHVISDSWSVNRFEIYCHVCWARSGVYRKLKEAIAAWNRRTPMTKDLICPDCGAIAEFYHGKITDCWYIKCPHCGRCRMGRLKSIAIKNWEALK